MGPRGGLDECGEFPPPLPLQCYYAITKLIRTYVHTCNFFSELLSVSSILNDIAVTCPSAYIIYVLENTCKRILN